jgi:hypothetical protein
VKIRFQALIFEAIVACTWKTKMAYVLMMSVTGTSFPAAILQLFAVKMIDLSFP